jgi:hypothetical protein
MLATATFPISVNDSPVTGRLGLSDRPERIRRTTKRAPAAGSVCLVVSADPLKQLMFGQAASRAGWRSVVCADMATAMQQVVAGVVGMALVDVATTEPATAMDCRRLVEGLSAHKNLLTVVCGRSNDSQEEVWARQHAVWMYLPGVAPESDLDPILSGAKEVADRLNKKRSPALVGSDLDF